LGVRIPFGHEPDGTQLSDHIGYSALYRLTPAPGWRTAAWSGLANRDCHLPNDWRRRDGCYHAGADGPWEEDLPVFLRTVRNAIDSIANELQ